MDKSKVRSLTSEFGGCIKQRQDGYYSLRLRFAGGQITAETMHVITKAADYFGKGYVHLTSRQGVEIPFVHEKNLEEAITYLENNDIRIGVSGKRIRGVVACQGINVCPHGIIDSQSLARKIDEIYVGASVAYKFKISVTGCPSACLKPQDNDFGIMGEVMPLWKEETCTYCLECVGSCPSGSIIEKDGKLFFDTSKCIRCGTCVLACKLDAIQSSNVSYKIFVGGKGGKHPRLGTPIASLHDQNHIFEILDKTIDYYNTFAKGSERVGDVIDRKGIEHFLARVIT